MRITRDTEVKSLIYNAIPKSVNQIETIVKKASPKGVTGPGRPHSMP